MGSRLTGSELQGQEAAAYVCPAYATTGVLFTGTYQYCEICKRCNLVLSLSYYKTNTFLPCGISKPKMSELGATYC